MMCDCRFSAKPWAQLMEMYAEEGDIQRSIQTAIRVAAYQWADYGEMTVRFPFLHISFVCSSFAVPHPDCARLFQIGPDPRPRQNIVHAHQHGSAGEHFEDHGQLFTVWKDVQGGGV